LPYCGNRGPPLKKRNLRRKKTNRRRWSFLGAQKEKHWGRKEKKLGHGDDKP